MGGGVVGGVVVGWAIGRADAPKGVFIICDIHSLSSSLCRAELGAAPWRWLDYCFGAWTTPLLARAGPRPVRRAASFCARAPRRAYGTSIRAYLVGTRSSTSTSYSCSTVDCSRSTTSSSTTIDSML